MNITTAHWARLQFGGDPKRWHVAVELRSICGRQDFDYPRVERRETRPESGKLCKNCVAKIAKINEVYIRKMITTGAPE